MAIERYDLNKCVGCRKCVDVCPMDVYRFNDEKRKSIIAYPENCQGCGMCYYFCIGGSLQLSLHNHMFPVVPMNATHGIDANHFIFAQPGLTTVRDRLAKEGDYSSESNY